MVLYIVMLILVIYLYVSKIMCWDMILCCWIMGFIGVFLNRLFVISVGCGSI